MRDFRRPPCGMVMAYRYEHLLINIISLNENNILNILNNISLKCFCLPILQERYIPRIINIQTLKLVNGWIVGDKDCLLLDSDDNSSEELARNKLKERNDNGQRKLKDLFAK
ncbi:hypothetical protein Trydic_g13252 [Trypoxylus dichotomus]